MVTLLYLTLHLCLRYCKQECNQLAPQNLYYHKFSLLKRLLRITILHNFSIWRDFLFTQCREKYYPRSPIETANSSRPVFLWRFVWKRAAPIRWFDFALCCIKRIVQYYPCGELTLTIFFFLDSGQGNVISTKVVCKNSRIRNKLVFIKYFLNKRHVILHSSKILE